MVVRVSVKRLTTNPSKIRMTADHRMQPALFDPPESTVSIDEMILYALGEFQARGHKLAERELALDRLHGAILRASRKFDVREISDEIVVETLRKLGAVIHEMPPFVAKKPYRVLAGAELCELARKYYRGKEMHPDTGPASVF